MVEASNPVHQFTKQASGGTRTMSIANKRTDTGVFWDEPLDLYIGGTINVNCYNNVLGFHAGDTIAGTIDIEIGEVFEATQL